MKGFETSEGVFAFASKGKSKKDCPAMKGFETSEGVFAFASKGKSKKDCPAMKGFETKLSPWGEGTNEK